ncbi:hypothetical protein TSMEX_005380, partial [Taenia solium]
LLQGKNKKTLELVVPALPSSTSGLKSPRTSDTILASNISVTEFLEALIAEPQIRYLWVPVQSCATFLGAYKRQLITGAHLVQTLELESHNAIIPSYSQCRIQHPRFTGLASPVAHRKGGAGVGKSGSSYRLRICDTELALCKDGGSDTAIHVWPWQEVGEPKHRKTEVRMPWLITDERPHLTPVLADVLQSTRPENLNEAKRRKLSRADSIPPPIVFDAKYHFTITVFVKDINASSKLVYQITCIRAMAFANGTQPAPEPEDNSLHGSKLITTSQVPKGKMQKRKGFSLCGLNCMGRKEKEEMDENPDSYPPRRSVDYTQNRPSVADVATPRNLQIVEPPSPPQRRRSSSIAKQTVTEEGDIETPSCSGQSSADENLVTKIPNVVVCSESHELVLNTTPSPSKNSASVNLSRYPTYTKSDATRQFLNEPQITSTCTPQLTQVEQAVKSTLYSLNTNAPKPSHESISNEVPQHLVSVTTQKNENTALGLTGSTGAENVDDCAAKSQPSPMPSPKKREMVVPPSSPARTFTTLHSGIPLPRNPTRAMVGATHHPPSPSGEFIETEASGRSNEATLEVQAAAIDSTIILGRSVNPDENKSVSGIDVVWESKLSLRPSEDSVFTDSDTNPEENAEVGPMDHPSKSPTSSPVQEIPVTTLTITASDSAIQNGATKADISPAQSRRPSGLISPKVVVNKPGINTYKGRNAPSLSPPVTTGPSGDSPNGGLTATSMPQAAPTAAGVSAKSSNIRPPMVTTETKVTRYQPRSSIPTRSNLAIRNGHDSPSASPSQVAVARSTSTGIRMPSQLSRQTLAKVTILRADPNVTKEIRKLEQRRLSNFSAGITDPSDGHLHRQVEPPVRTCSVTPAHNQTVEA